MPSDLALIYLVIEILEPSLETASRNDSHLKFMWVYSVSESVATEIAYWVSRFEVN